MNKLLYKGLICDESFTDFEILDSSNPIFHVDEVDEDEILDVLIKAIEGSKSIGKAKSWSAKLMEDNPNSRWVTIRGNRVLIRGNADGTATVVFSANPAFEHLKIVPQTSEQYKKIQEEKEEKKITAKEAQDNKEVKQAKQSALRNIRKDYFDQVAIQLSLDVSQQDLRTGEKEIKIVKGKLNVNEIKEKSTGVKELIEVAKSDSEKKVVTKALEDLAEKKLTEGLIEEVLGEGVVDGGEVKTGISSIDEKLSRVEISKEDALAIWDAKRKKQEAEKEVKSKLNEKKFKSSDKDLASFENVGIVDWNKEPVSLDKATEEALSQIANRERARMNTRFYNILDERSGSKSTSKFVSEGAKQSLNALASIVEGTSLPEGFVNMVGVDNASRIIGDRLFSKDNKDELKKQIEQFNIVNSQNIVKDVLESSEERLNRITAYTEQGELGILAKKTAAIQKARQLGQIGKEIGMAAGSLESTARVLDSLRNDTKDDSDIVFKSSGASLDDQLKDFGLSKNDYEINPDGKDFSVRIKSESFDKLFKQNQRITQRNERIKAIKDGSALEKDWKPKGTRDSFYDWKTPEQMRDKFGNTIPDGWEKYQNKKGENGYTSQFKEGEELFRKNMPIKFKDSQQRALKMLFEQKRVVGNLGAGIGKTVAYLGAISELKSIGKLKDSFAVMTPPSRLRDEFFKDNEKFYPDLNVLKLDEVKGGLEAKKQAILDAKNGKYDIVLTGHDSMKSQGIADFIAEQKPAFVGVDEAHETFKSEDQKKSGRFKAIKKLAESTEYFFPATGTPVRNKIGEFSSLLHITRPDLIPSESAFTKKYENVNQNTVAFQDFVNNEFRREFDDIVISESTKITPKKIEKKNTVALSPEQSEKYKENEAIYRLDRSSKGFGVIDNETGELVQKGKNNLTHFDSIDFKPARSKLLQSKQEKKFLSENGMDSSRYRVVKLGKEGAAARRDSRHDRLLNGGDYKTNSKIQSIFKNIEANSEDKHIVFFKRQDSKKAMTEGLAEQLGLKPEQIAIIDGKTRMNKRKEQVKQFQTNPDVKVILLSDAGATGLNLQSGDHIHHLSRSDTFALQEQQNARAYRTGREKDVNVNYYDSNTPYDDNKVDNVKRKKRISESLGDYDDQITLEKLSDKISKSVYVDSELFGKILEDQIINLQDSTILTKALFDNFDIDYQASSKLKSKIVINNETGEPLEVMLSKQKQYSDVIIQNQNMEILFLKRNKLDKFGNGLWCLAGGTIEDEESPLDAAVREFLEETSVILDKTLLKKIVNFNNKDKSISHYFFYEGFYTEGVDESIVLESSEHSEYKWISLFDLDKFDMLLDLNSRIKKMFPKFFIIKSKHNS